MHVVDMLWLRWCESVDGCSEGGNMKENVTYVELTRCGDDQLLGCTWFGCKHRTGVGRQFNHTFMIIN
jgi:hypothetical protein